MDLKQPSMEVQKFYNKAYDWVLTVGPRILIAIVVLLLGLWFIKILKKWIHHALTKKAVEYTLVPFLLNLTITALQILLILLVMQILNIQLTLFAALIAAFGVAAGLALSGTLQNFASGVLILILKPFRTGDNIITQGQEGTVSSIEIFYTIIKTFDNKTVIVPNSKLSNEVIINTSREGTRRVDIELKFSYGVDLEKIKSTIEKTISNSQNFLKDPVHRIGIIALEPDGYKIIINIWTNAHGFQDTKLLFQEKLMADLKTDGVKLPGM
jgi:small conductance mechanosensitive channel